MFYGWEFTYGITPLTNDPMKIREEDKTTNPMEYQRGTEPANPESHPHRKCRGFLYCLMIIASQKKQAVSYSAGRKASHLLY